MRAVRRLCALAVAGLLAAGCAEDDPPAGTAGGSGGEARTTAGPAAGSGTAPAAPPPDPAPAGGDTSRARDGVWRVGEAGEVEIESRAGALRLVATRPAEGWTASVRDAGPEAVEVILARDDHEWTFRAARENGRLSVAMSGRLPGSPPGPVQVGDAGTVVVGLPPGRSLALASVSAGGWSVSTSTRNDRGEVAFTRDAARWTLAVARAGDRADLAVEYSVEGP